ncbi:MAG: HAD family acid phosphatase [Steroidobacteraceae bacterium]
MNMSSRWLAMLAAIATAGMAALAPAGARAEPVAREQLHATLWMQRAAEYRAMVAQTYRLATERLELALAPGSAALEQADIAAQRLAAMPPAIILDLDETVLDNSYYQARLLRAGRDYDDASWAAWVEEAAAPALPGAREFLRAAAARGIRVFYVTNRECLRQRPEVGDPCPAKTATLRNLRALGLPGADDPDSLLLRRERPEWAVRSKSPRRAWIGERYRVIALFGDDLQDFVDRGVYLGRGGALDPLFGSRWFLLPNAMYGSWERALVDGTCADGMPPAQCSRAIVARKYDALEVEPPPLALPNARRWSPDDARLRLATWNIEFLLEPATHAALASSCTTEGRRLPGAERALPCGVAARLDRGPADLAALRRYAARLDADVVALQEVDGPGAAAQVFPGHEFCFSTRPHLQNNGFAIRAGLPFRCEAEYLPLALPDDSSRRGVVVTLFPDSRDAITLMSVHLKSGCPAGPLGAPDRPACVTLARQVEPLEQWIDAQASAGRRFAVLGDFNRRFRLERGPARDAVGALQQFWPEINDGEPRGATLVDVTRGQPFVGCRPGDRYAEYIDTVLLGQALARDRLKGSFVRQPYDADDAATRKLSDHCPVGVDLRWQSAASKPTSTQTRR